MVKTKQQIFMLFILLICVLLIKLSSSYAALKNWYEYGIWKSNTHQTRFSDIRARKMKRNCLRLYKLYVQKPTEGDLQK